MFYWTENLPPDIYWPAQLIRLLIFQWYWLVVRLIPETNRNNPKNEGYKDVMLQNWSDMKYKISNRGSLELQTLWRCRHVAFRRLHDLSYAADFRLTRSVIQSSNKKVHLTSFSLILTLIIELSTRRRKLYSACRNITVRFIFFLLKLSLNLASWGELAHKIFKFVLKIHLKFLPKWFIMYSS